jgi:3-oxoacyl-[acyl-carrier-protein] synthase III
VKDNDDEFDLDVLKQEFEASQDDQRNYGIMNLALTTDGTQNNNLNAFLNASMGSKKSSPGRKAMLMKDESEADHTKITHHKDMSQHVKSEDNIDTRDQIKFQGTTVTESIA